MTVTPDEETPRTSRIIFRDKGGENQKLPVPEASPSGVVVDNTEHGNELTSASVSYHHGRRSRGSETEGVSPIGALIYSRGRAVRGECDDHLVMAPSRVASVNVLVGISWVIEGDELGMGFNPGPFEGEGEGEEEGEGEGEEDEEGEGIGVGCTSPREEERVATGIPEMLEEETTGEEEGPLLEVPFTGGASPTTKAAIAL